MRLKTLIVTGLLLITAHANASKLDFLKDSILTALSEQDIKSFHQTAYKTLETVDDKEVVYWQGESGVKGKLLAQFSYQSSGLPCRRIRFAFQDSSKLTEAYKFDICKSSNSWKIVATPASSFTNDDWQRFDEELEYSLNNVRNGSPVSWVSVKSGVSGVFVPLSTETKSQKTCRNIAISLIDRQGRTSDGSYRFCQQTDHSWTRIISSL
jgi:surface antigen